MSGNKHLNYAQRLFLAFDQFLNAVFNGWPDETLSARTYRQYINTDKFRWIFAYRLINILFFWQKDHCKEAYRHELEHYHMPRTYYRQTNKDRVQAKDTNIEDFTKNQEITNDEIYR